MNAAAGEAARKHERFQKNSGFEISSLPGKLADCQNKIAENCELFIVEGIRQVVQPASRDRRIKQYYLEGKILNTEKARPDKAVSSAEIATLTWDWF